MPEHSGVVLASPLFTVVLLALGLLSSVAARPSARSLQQDGCSGIDVTASPYNADASGNGDSSPAFNAAIASAAGEFCVCCNAGLPREHFELIKAKGAVYRSNCLRPSGHLHGHGRRQHQQRWSDCERASWSQHRVSQQCAVVCEGQLKYDSKHPGRLSGHPLLGLRRPRI